jgi:hydroxypyruvate reductase
VQKPTCLLAGGETTVTLGASPGRGGRNQEFALAAALELAGAVGVAVLSGGTDGTDGPTDAAGGLVDGGTAERAQSAKLDAQRHLDGHDAYPLLQAVGDLLTTGPTGTNVMDVAIGLTAG